jgi:hypothetical protein
MFTEEQLQVYHEEREVLRRKVAQAERPDINDLRELWVLTYRLVLGYDPPRKVEA